MLLLRKKLILWNVLRINYAFESTDRSFSLNFFASALVTQELSKSCEITDSKNKRVLLSVRLKSTAAVSGS